MNAPTGLPSDDQRAIRAVAEAYAAAVDDGDIEASSAVCAPGFVLEVPAELNPDGQARTQTDPAAVVATLESFVRTRHTIDRVHASVNGEEAAGFTLCQAHHLYCKRSGAVHDYHTYLRYHDRFVRIDGLWLFEHRRLELEWSTDGQVRMPEDAAIDG